MSASFRMLWVYARGRWSIQGENKVYVFRRTFFFFPLDAVEVRGWASAHGAVLSWEPGMSSCHISCCYSLAWLGLAQCPQYSAARDPELSSPSVTLQGQMGSPFMTQLPPCFYCLDWCQSWAVEGWSEWTRAVFQVCVSSLCYGFRQLILPIDLDWQKVEIIVYVGRELGTLWVYKQKWTVALRLS